MKIEEGRTLATLTTFKAGGPAAVVAHIATIDDLREALALARDRNLPYYPLGEGSNVLASDTGYDGMILRMELPGIEFIEDGDTTRLIAGAGVRWDDVVTEAAERSLWGIENLAGIPGTMGAAPVQNIGAYGAELSHVVREVEVYDVTTDALHTLAATDCALGYRDSRFKHEPHLLITKVTLSLSKTPAPRITYGDLLKAQEAGDDMTTPKAIGAVVRSIRAKKFPDLAVAGTAGSFFKNPILTQEKYDELVHRFGPVPQFPNPDGIKVPLAFILDKALALRGFRLAHAHLFGAQPLVLVLDAGGSAQEAEALACEVEKRVYDATGITIEREVRTLAQR